MDDPSATILLKLAVVFLLVLTNGVFVAAEFAVVSVRRSRIEALVAQGNRRARNVVRIMEDVRAFISAVQFGITVASLALGSIGEETFAQMFQPVLAKIIPGNFGPALASHSIATAM